jgi:hypothetical protein
MRLGRVVTGVALLGLGGLFAAGFVFSRSGSPYLWPSRTFDATAWRATPKEGRFVFYRDLERRRLLADRTLEELSELLGAPDFIAPDGRYATFVIKYADRGEYSFNAIYLLHVDFDPRGRVVSIGVRAD